MSLIVLLEAHSRPSVAASKAVHIPTGLHLILVRKQCKSSLPRRSQPGLMPMNPCDSHARARGAERASHAAAC